MTEKHYGGASSHGFKEKSSTSGSASFHDGKKQQKSNVSNEEFDLQKLKLAGEIAREAKKFARSFVKKDLLLLEIAEKIEAKIVELGGRPAFPVNLSINEIAAHYTPLHDDQTRAHGLLKVDLGVSVDGFCADTAISIDLADSQENKTLIEAAEKALANAVDKFEEGIAIREIGAEIENTIRTFGVQPVVNLSGHSIERYNLHAGTTIPNHDNSMSQILEEGTYAVEPFATFGLGEVINGKPSGIYQVESENAVRDSFAREVLAFVDQEYQTLPFCSRWLVKKFGTRALIALKRLEEAGILHHYPQLVEKSKRNVAQAEHTIVLTGNEKVVTT